MNFTEYSYLELLQEILDTGEERIDRTGVGTLSVFGRQLRCNLAESFPAITTKKLAFNAVIGEILWFVEGSSDERRLSEITHGTRDPSKTTIWSGNASADYWVPKAKFPGDLGRVYGVQWRQWQRPDGTHVDQLAKIIDTIRNNPTDRRMILTAFNVGELEQMALPPCHMFAQFYVNQKNKSLSCQVYIRSSDVGLGLPFNIASYAALVYMIAEVTNLTPGELVLNLGDAHIYLNHVDAIKEQLTRAPKKSPTLRFARTISDIDDFNISDFVLENYECHSAIKMEMAV